MPEITPQVLLDEAERIGDEPSAGDETDALAQIAIAILKVGAGIIRRLDSFEVYLGEDPGVPQGPEL